MNLLALLLLQAHLPLAIALVQQSLLIDDLLHQLSFSRLLFLPKLTLPSFLFQPRFLPLPSFDFLLFLQFFELPCQLLRSSGFISSCIFVFLALRTPQSALCYVYTYLTVISGLFTFRFIPSLSPRNCVQILSVSTGFRRCETKPVPMQGKEFFPDICGFIGFVVSFTDTSLEISDHFSSMAEIVSANQRH